MKNIFSTKWNYENKVLYFIILICFSFIAYYHLSSGYSMSSDSQRYSRWADDLIQLNFNFFDLFLIDKNDIRPHLFFFSIPIFLIALCKIFFVNEWQFVFLLLNLSLVFLSLIIFTKSLLLIKVRPLLICLTLPIIATSVDILTWPRFILTDMIYSFLVLLSTFFIIKVIVNNKINYTEIFLVIFMLLGTRPSSFPVIFAIISFTIILKLKFFSNKKNILFFILTTFILIPFILGFFYFFLENNFSGISKVDFITSKVKSGMIIHDRPDTWINVSNDFKDIIILYFLRLINFFNPYASTFSILHITLNVFQLSLILLSIFIWVYFECKTKVENYDKIFFYIIILSLSVAAFHSFILIDYDWRYRFPTILPLFMLLPISIEMIFKKIRLNLD